MLAAAAAPGAAAQDAPSFDQARELFRAGQYADAARAFERLVEASDPRGEDVVLHFESRKYLGITYLYLRREEDARREVRAYLEYILPRTPSYPGLDPYYFAQDVVEFFDEVKREIEAEQAARDEAREQARRDAERVRESATAAYVAELERQASERVIERTRSRWVAALPFGAGQFQNGHEALGWTLLVAESGLVVTSVVSFLLRAGYPDVDPRSGLLEDGSAVDVGERDLDAIGQEYDRVARRYELTNWVSTGLFVLVALVGVLDAQLRFEEIDRRVERRPLPDDPRARGGVEASIGPTGVRLVF